MKHLKIILINLLIITFFNTGLKATDNPNFSKKVRNKVAKQMASPDNKMEGNVSAQFSVALDKTIVIKIVDSENLLLKEFVRKELEKMQLNIEHIDTQKSFTINFIFKKEDTNN